MSALLYIIFIFIGAIFFGVLFGSDEGDGMALFGLSAICVFSITALYKKITKNKDDILSKQGFYFIYTIGLIYSVGSYYSDGNNFVYGIGVFFRTTDIIYIIGFIALSIFVIEKRQYLMRKISSGARDIKRNNETKSGNKKRELERLKRDRLEQERLEQEIKSNQEKDRLEEKILEKERVEKMRLEEEQNNKNIFESNIKSMKSNILKGGRMK